MFRASPRPPAFIILLRFLLIGFALLLGSAASAAGSQERELDKFFRRYAGLSDSQIETIRSGKSLAKVLKSRIPDEVFVFGAVYIAAAPESYVKISGDIDELRKLPGVLAIRKFSDPPHLSDLEGFTVEAGDVEDLKTCKPGNCKLQLPAEAMAEFRRSVDWTAPDAAEQINRRAQQMALQFLERYLQGGNAALGVYHDKKHPTEVAEIFQSLLRRVEALPAHVPDLDRYLLDYPNVELDNAESEFFWEKVNFGLKPTLRIVQRIVYRGAGPDEPIYGVAMKQLYSSHYFQAALDLTACVRDTDQPGRSGFYLITVKGSQQAGLTGFTGGFARRSAVGKSRSSLERTLARIKQRLEAAEPSR
jgi:hypothetical protein